MHIFISYAKADTYDLAVQVRDELRKIADVTVWMDETLEPGESWALQIQQEIDAADYVVALLSPDVNRPIAGKQRRSFVLNEIDYAQQENKPIIPVMAQPTRIPVQIAGVQYIDFTADQTQGMIRLIRKITRHKGNLQPEIPTLRAAKLPDMPTKPVSRRPLFIVSVLALAAVLLVVALLPTIAPLVSPTLPFNAFIPSGTPASSATDEPAADLGGTQTDQAQSIIQQTDVVITNSFETQVAQVQGTAQEANLALTQIMETQVAQALQTTRQVNLHVTDLATGSAAAVSPIEHNADWTPVYETFSDVDMALVPTGCFMMGSETGSGDEKVVHEQCFDTPFWIDRYEVTNQQFGSDGFFGDDSQPRDSVTWAEARDFCAGRNARLPTEREWEYAARGPDNLVYPWGNDFIGANVVHVDNSGDQSAEVGSRSPAGDSWIGASDLSGNLWEWVSSLYRPYPYTSDDGREDLEKEGDARVLRGGSWGREDALLSAALRSGSDPTEINNEYGFRCARDY